MPNLSTCNTPTCAVTVDGFVETCPKCGGPMRAIRESPLRAMVLVACGVILIVMMGGITLMTAPMMLNPGAETPGGSSWAGTLEQGQVALALFGVVILFGFVSLANGVYQLKTGREHKVFIWLTLALAALLVAVIFAFIQAFGELPG